MVVGEADADAVGDADADAVGDADADAEGEEESNPSRLYVIYEYTIAAITTIIPKNTKLFIY